MSKKGIVVWSAAIICMFVFGIWLGNHWDALGRTENTADKIAVINQDIGTVKADNTTINYAAAVIETLPPEYELVSLSAAEKGLEDNTYAALLVFPSDMSNNIVSINSEEPSISTVQFKINPALPDEDYIHTFSKLISVQTDINQTISYMYVDSIYKEFHSAQNQVGAVLNNDSTDMRALEELQRTTFVQNIDYGNIPEIILEPKEIDFDAFVEKVNNYADDMSATYEDSYALAKEDYTVLQDEVNATVHTINLQAALWQNATVKYAADVGTFAQETGLWNDALETWKGDLSLVATDVQAWKDGLDTWETDVNNWEDNTYTTLTGAVNSYKGETEQYYDDLYSEGQTSANAQIAAYNTWVQDSVIGWATTLHSELGDYPDKTESAIQDAQELIDEKADGLVAYADALEAYADALETYAGELEIWQQGLAADDAGEEQGKMPEKPNLSDYYSEAAPTFTDVEAEALKDSMPLFPAITPPDVNAAPQSISDWSSFTVAAENAGMTAPVFDDTAYAALKSDLESQKPVLTMPSLTIPTFQGGDKPVLAAEKPETIAGNFDVLNSSVGSLETDVNSFDVENYLTEETRGEAHEVIAEYETHLGEVRTTLDETYRENQFDLDEAFLQHQDYSLGLIENVQSVYDSENEKIQLSLDSFYTVKEDTSSENKEMLQAFSLKLPNSRQASVVNKKVLNATVLPAEFKNTSVWIPNEEIAIVGTQNIGIYLGIGILVLIGMIIFIFTSGKKEEAEKVIFD